MKPIIFLSLFFCISTTLFTMEHKPNRIIFINENGKRPFDDFPCDQCKEQKDVTKFKRHILCAHTDLVPYVCNYQGCTIKFDNIDSMRNHASTVHHTRYIPSPEATELVLKTIKPYLMRLKWEYSCPKCGDLFPSRISLQNHTNKNHSTDNEVKKVDLPQSSSDSGNNEQVVVPVIKPVAETLPFPCYKCKQTSVPAFQFKQHILYAHTNLVPYVCNYQGCLFQSNNIPTIYAHSMNFHQTRYIPSTEAKELVLKTIKPYLMRLKWEYSCPKCGDLFPTPTSMRSHINKVHQTENKVQKVAVPQFSNDSGNNEQEFVPAIKPAAAQTPIDPFKAQEETFPMQFDTDLQDYDLLDQTLLEELANFLEL